ncbi:MAG: thermonuclease family protein [Alphaproteobacteria bacterium]
MPAKFVAAAPPVSAPVPTPAMAAPVAAEETSAPAVPGLPDRIKRPMRAVDPMTLRGEGYSIRLWGIKPAQTSETPLELQALDRMDSLIQEGEVDCKIMPGSQMPDLLGRCISQSHQDLAIELLSSGFVIVDRRQTYNSIFATAYEQAQEKARLSSAGVWSFVNKANDPKNGLPGWMQPYVSVVLPIALIVGPFGGLLLVSLIMWYWLKRMASAQEQESEQSSRKEAMLLTRERQVLVSTLEGELIENKNKIEAFLVIYGDLLRTLKDPNEVPKYQQGGDIVQKHPSFSKTVFEANVNKLSLLDIKLAGKVSKLYSSMPKDQEYINLEPGVPLDTAVQLVEKVLKEAEAMLVPINAVIGGLQGATAVKPAAPQAQAAA